MKMEFTSSEPTHFILILPHQGLHDKAFIRILRSLNCGA